MRCGQRLAQPFVVRVFNADGTETEIRNRLPRDEGKVFVALHSRCNLTKSEQPKKKSRPTRYQPPRGETISVVDRKYMGKFLEVRRDNHRILMVLPRNTE